MVLKRIVLFVGAGLIVLLASCQTETSTPTAVVEMTATQDPTVEIAVKTPSAEVTAVETSEEPAAAELVFDVLVNSDAVEYHAQWSPDGQTLGYVAVMEDGPQIWFLPLDTGEAYPLELDLQGDFAFIWSSDGSKLVFDAYDSTDHLAIWTMDLPDGVPTLLTKEGKGKANPDWSPDDTKVIYTTLGDLWIHPIGSDTPEKLTTDPASDWHPKWSPDGSTILFSSDRSGNTDLWIIPVEGGEATQITTNEAYDDRGVWSPDGQFIAFLSDRSGNDDIWLYSMADGTETQITTDEGVDSMPAWHPDGKSIIFASELGGNMGIWSVDVTSLVGD